MAPALCLFTGLLVFFASCSGPTTSQQPVKPRLAGGPCEGCEAIFEYGQQPLQATDTLPGFSGPGTRLRLTGTMYQPDGKTPASGVILYVYHTDSRGLYSARPDQTGWGRRHGYNRGWVKTGADGRYTFCTIRPGIYPDRTSPSHIHPTILEPSGRYYYIEDFYFQGDSLLTEQELNPATPRGGNGVVQLQEQQSILTGHRDIVLGKNVPGYE